MDSGQRSVLLVHHDDVTAPLRCTVPYYLTDRLSESHDVHVLCRKRSSKRNSDLSSREYVLHDIDTGDVPMVSGLLFVLLSTVYAMVLGTTYRYDVVQAFQKDMIQGRIAALFGGSKFVVGLQSVPVRQYRDFKRSRGEQSSVRERISLSIQATYATLVRYLLQSTSEITCLTDGIRRVTEDVYDVNLSDAHVVGMGIDYEKFATGQSMGNGGTKHDPWVVTYCGSISANRGLDHVIKALAETEHDVELRIAGSGTEQDIAALQQTARDHGVSDRVQWLGVLPHDNIPDLLASSDIAISPLDDIESFRISFPAKLLEYMAAGCLVIATNIPSHRQILDDGENGFLYQGGRDGFLEALRTCVETQERHPSIRRAAKRTASEYRWSIIIEQHEEVLFGSDPGSS